MKICIIYGWHKLAICKKRDCVRILLFYACTLIGILNPHLISGQENLSISYVYGNIHPHNTLIKPLIKEPVKGFTINYSLKNSCGESWRRFFNYPNQGISYNFMSYGNPEVLGNSHSLSYFLQFSLLPRRRYFDIGLAEYIGIGYFEKKYDPVKNPDNQAISSNFNIGATIRLYTKIRIKPIYIEYSRGLNHFSNGLTKEPNLGINIKNESFTIGYEFENQPIRKKISKTERDIKTRNEFWIYGASGMKEITSTEQKKYTPVNASINYTYRTSVINKMGIGFDFVYDPSIEDFASLNYDYHGETPLNFRYGISLHNEFILGKTGIFTSYGLNLQMNEYYTRQRYYKAGVKFYFNNFIGVVLLRAIPLFRADLVEFGIGYRIMPKNKKNEH